MPRMDLTPFSNTTNPPEAIPDPFAPENPRLSQSFAEMVAVKKVVTTAPMRKPSAQDFVLVHPDPRYRDNFPIIGLIDDREESVVASRLVPELFPEKCISKARTTSWAHKHPCRRSLNLKAILPQLQTGLDHRYRAATLKLHKQPVAPPIQLNAQLKHRPLRLRAPCGPCPRCSSTRSMQPRTFAGFGGAT